MNLATEIDMTLIKKKVDSELGYDSDLVLDEQDEERLNKMPELQRETLLEERRQKREQLVQRYNLLRQRKAQINSTKPAVRVISQSMLSSSSSSSDSSSSSSSHSRGARKQDVQAIKPSLVSKTDCSGFRKIQLTRDQIIKSQNLPYFEDLICGAFARVVAGTSNGYRLVRLVSMIKCQSYQVSNSKG